MATGSGSGRSTTTRKQGPAQRPEQGDAAPPKRTAKTAAPAAPASPAASEPAEAPQSPLAALLPLMAAMIRPEPPTNTETLAAALADPFPLSSVEWRQQHVMRDGTKALYVPYLTSRAVQERLDAVCGVAGWQNAFKPGPAGGVLCGISIRVVQPNGLPEWITKWDGADNSQIEAVKGGISDSQKRAAVEWGIGRYLYRVPQQWLKIDGDKRRTQEPSLPPAFLPKRSGGNGPELGISAERRKAEQGFHATGAEWAGHPKEWDAQRPHVIAIFGAAQVPPLVLVHNSTGELSDEHVVKLTVLLRKKIERNAPPKKMLTPEGRDAAGRRGQQVEEPEPPEEDYPLTAEEREAAEEQEPWGEHRDVEAGGSGTYGDPGEMPDFLVNG